MYGNNKSKSEIELEQERMLKRQEEQKRADEIAELIKTKQDKTTTEENTNEQNRNYESSTNSPYEKPLFAPSSMKNNELATEEVGKERIEFNEKLNDIKDTLSDITQKYPTLIESNSKRIKSILVGLTFLSFLILCYLLFQNLFTNTSWELTTIVDEELITDISLVEKKPTQEEFNIYVETTESNYIVTSKSMSYHSLISKLGELKNPELYLEDNYFDTNKNITIFHPTTNNSRYIKYATATDITVTIVELEKDIYNELNKKYNNIFDTELPTLANSNLVSDKTKTKLQKELEISNI